MVYSAGLFVFSVCSLWAWELEFGFSDSLQVLTLGHKQLKPDAALGVFSVLGVTRCWVNVCFTNEPALWNFAELLQVIEYDWARVWTYNWGP